MLHVCVLSLRASKCATCICYVFLLGMYGCFLKKQDKKKKNREAMEKLSPYAEKLTAATNERYKEKISLMGGLDPFLKHEASLSLQKRLEQQNTP